MLHDHCPDDCHSRLTAVEVRLESVVARMEALAPLLWVHDLLTPLTIAITELKGVASGLEREDAHIYGKITDLADRLDGIIASIAASAQEGKSEQEKKILLQIGDLSTEISVIKKSREDASVLKKLDYLQKFFDSTYKVGLSLAMLVGLVMGWFTFLGPWLQSLFGGGVHAP